VKAYRWHRQMKKASCAKGSVRTIKRGNTVVRVCCPKGPGHWNGRTCKVGTRAYEVGVKKSGR
jgi:hypothetical protein